MRRAALMRGDAARAGGPGPRRRLAVPACRASLLREGETVGIFPRPGVSTSYTVRALMPGCRGPGAGDRRAAGADGDLGPAADPHRAARPLDLHRGRPVSLLVGSRSTSAPGDDVAGGTVGARRGGCRPCSTTAKAVNLLSTNPGVLLDYVNAPVGKGRAPEHPLPPLVAVPTTPAPAARAPRSACSTCWRST